MAKKTPVTKPKVEAAAKKRAPGREVKERAAVEEPAAERVKRPPLPRSEPIRSWSTLFGAPSEASEAGVGPLGIPGLPSMPGIGGIPGIPGMNAAAGLGPEAVRRGVEMGYRVVDEYMRQGASVANAFSNPGRPRSATGSGPGAEPDLSKMTERMMQYASDFTSLWYDAMGMMMGTMSQQARPDASKRPSAEGVSVPDGSPPILGHSRIILDVRSALAAEIIVALDEPAYSGALTVEVLKPRIGKSSIEGARVEPASEAQGPLKVHVHVASNVAPGRYTGAILDALSGKPKGRLTVTLSK
jgi:hypothetical protein